MAADALDTFADGVLFVGLAPISDPVHVLPALAQAAGLHEIGRRPVLEALTEHLREMRLLLLLDNCEQILDAAPEIAEILATCPGVRVLATSRAPLHLRGEREYAVPPLPLPARPTSSERPSLADLATNPAVALLRSERQMCAPTLS